MEYVTKMPSSLHLFGEIWSHATKKKPRSRDGGMRMKKRGIDREASSLKVRFDRSPIFFDGLDHMSIPWNF